MPTAGKQQTILVVEDDRPIAAAITKKLELSGFATLSATRVDDAIELMKSHQPIDGIWLDHYLLGDKNGLDFVASVRDNPDWQSLPIFIVSNTASDDKIKLYNQLGITRYYIKADQRLETIIADIQAAIDNEVRAGSE